MIRGRGMAPVVGLVIVALVAVACWWVAGRHQHQADANTNTSSTITSTARVVVSSCSVLYVVDGDTIRCEDGDRVRLLGVDAAEISHDGQPAQCYSTQATMTLRDLVGGRTVTLRSDPGQPVRDVYGRRLAYVTTPAGIDVNVEVVRRGAAQARVSRPALVKASPLAAAEREARQAGRGMWSTC